MFNISKAYKIHHDLAPSWLSSLMSHHVTLVFCSSNILLMYSCNFMNLACCSLLYSSVPCLKCLMLPFPICSCLTPVLPLRCKESHHLELFYDIYFLSLNLWKCHCWVGSLTMSYMGLYHVIIIITNQVTECVLSKLEAWVDSPLHLMIFTS